MFVIQSGKHHRVFREDHAKLVAHKIRGVCSHTFFDAYEVSCRARTEDLLYSVITLIRPKKRVPRSGDSALYDPIYNDIYTSKRSKRECIYINNLLNISQSFGHPQRWKGSSGRIIIMAQPTQRIKHPVHSHRLSERSA